MPLVAQTPVPTLDTHPAFMQVVTNLLLKTNYVVVTNSIVVTNATVMTNFYNAQGVLLQGLLESSNTLSAAGSFTANPSQQIAIRQGTTSFDRKKNQALITAMTLTAEKAAPSVVALLVQTARRYQAEDPAAAIKGDADAATRGF
ncbi:MAG: hypothetical protein EXS36_16025 [Pedosphaera sp.]|nr:hypothetical protein [Pedosphaera sp.]